MIFVLHIAYRYVSYYRDGFFKKFLSIKFAWERLQLTREVRFYKVPEGEQYKIKNYEKYIDYEEIFEKADVNMKIQNIKDMSWRHVNNQTSSFKLASQLESWKLLKCI